jgi:hypothetical protein
MTIAKAHFVSPRIHIIVTKGMNIRNLFLPIIRTTELIIAPQTHSVKNPLATTHPRCMIATHMVVADRLAPLVRKEVEIGPTMLQATETTISLIVRFLQRI